VCECVSSPKRFIRCICEFRRAVYPLCLFQRFIRYLLSP
jgi:hypothetical protein